MLVLHSIPFLEYSANAIFSVGKKAKEAAKSKPKAQAGKQCSWNPVSIEFFYGWALAQENKLFAPVIVVD